MAQSGSHAANRLNPFGDPYEFQDGKQRDENGAKVYFYNNLYHLLKDIYLCDDYEQINF